MELKTGKEIQELLSSITYADKQRQAQSFDLTVREIHRVISPGALDFGGSEFQPAGLQAIPPHKRNPDDKYGWWELSPGDYVVRFNEKLALPDGCIAMLMPHERLLRAGATHSVLLLQSAENSSQIPLVVSSGGVKIKENARISIVIVWSERVSTDE